MNNALNFLLNFQTANVGSVAGAVVSVQAMVEALTSAIKAAASFDDAMIKYQAQTEFAAGAVEGLRSALYDVSATYGFSEDTLESLAAATSEFGYTTNKEIQGFIKISARMTEVMGLSADRAAKLTYVINKKLGVSLDRTSALTNRFVNLSKKSLITMEEIADVVGENAPIIKRAKYMNELAVQQGNLLSVNKNITEDTISSLTAVSAISKEAGLEAGTFNDVLGELAKGSVSTELSKYNQIITASGYSMTELQTAAKAGDYAKFMKALVSGSKALNLTQIEQAGLAESNYGLTQEQIVALRDLNDVKLDDLIKASKDDAEALASVTASSAALKSSLNKLTTLISGAVLPVIIDFGNVFLGIVITVLTPFLSALGFVLSALVDLPTPFKVLTTLVLAYTAATYINTAAILSSVVASSLYQFALVKQISIMTGVSKVMTLYAALQNAITAGSIKDIAVNAVKLAWTTAVTAATWAMTAAQWAYNAALTANPIGLTIVLLAGLFLLVKMGLDYLSQWVDLTNWVMEATLALGYVLALVFAPALAPIVAIIAAVYLLYQAIKSLFEIMTQENGWSKFKDKISGWFSSDKKSPSPTPSSDAAGSTSTSEFTPASSPASPELSPVAREFATGGVVGGPTYSLIGEAGPEAVIPLDTLRGSDPKNPVYVEIVNFEDQYSLQAAAKFRAIYKYAKGAANSLAGSDTFIGKMLKSMQGWVGGAASAAKGAVGEAASAGIAMLRQYGGKAGNYIADLAETLTSPEAVKRTIDNALAILKLDTGIASAPTTPANFKPVNRNNHGATAGRIDSQGNPYKHMGTDYTNLIPGQALYLPFNVKFIKKSDHVYANKADYYSEGGSMTFEDLRTNEQFTVRHIANMGDFKPGQTITAGTQFANVLPFEAFANQTENPNNAGSGVEIHIEGTQGPRGTGGRGNHRLTPEEVDSMFVPKTGASLDTNDSGSSTLQEMRTLFEDNAQYFATMLYSLPREQQYSFIRGVSAITAGPDVTG